MHFLFSLLMLALPQEKHPPDGRYTYEVVYAEWDKRAKGQHVTVVIHGDSIRVIHAGGTLSGKKGEVIDSGIIMKHKPTGKWIIGRRPAAAHAKEVGGCSDGPAVIDFKKKQFHLC